MEKLVLIGAGGHCKVVIDMLKDSYDIAGITDIDESKHGKNFYGISVIGNDEFLRYIYHKGVRKALITLGSTGDASVRKRLYGFAADLGFEMINAISPQSIISQSVCMGDGNTVMDGAVIHSDTVIGSNIIINTGCIIEHDCIIGNHSHIAPGAKLSGGIRIGRQTHIGLGACIIQGVSVGTNCIVGAGAVVIDDIPDNSVYVGVPAKVIKTR